MARPLRIDFPGALYHVTSRGDRREAIFADDVDREQFLAVLGQALARFDARVLAYCLMGNHYHLVLYMRSGHLSRLMRHVNGVYTQAVNRRHGLVGHLFQGRFKAILVDRDAYLLEVCRYVDLNPVRAKLVRSPDDWRWSSYRALARSRADGADRSAGAPPWLDTHQIWGFMLQRPVADAADARRAARSYAQWVAQGAGVRLWDEALRGQIFLGDEAFAERMKARATPQRRAAKAVPRAQRESGRSAAKPLAAYFGGRRPRDASIRLAYVRGHHTMTEIAAHLGLSVSRVSRVIQMQEELQAKAKEET
jgi:putative transposase